MPDKTARLRAAFLLRDAGEGGAERTSLMLANGLARSGLDVTVFFSRARGPLLDSALPSVKKINLRGSFTRLLIEMKRGNFDFLLPVYTSMRALLAKKILGGPFQVVLSQHNMFTLDRGPLQTRLRFIRCRWLYPFASACVCVSKGVADEMKELGLLPKEKIRVIYNPAVTRDIEHLAQAPAPHPWLEPGEPPVILGAGRLGDQKDFGTLIRAFARLAEKRQDLRLIILGEGKQRKELQELVSELNLPDRVRLPGYDPNPYAWMARSALFVLSSRFEGFGLVTAEALACGCNVVSTDCRSGPAEILADGEFGSLARVGDPEDLARAMADRLDHPLPPEVLKGRAAFFSEERSVSGWLELLSSLRGGR